MKKITALALALLLAGSSALANENGKDDKGKSQGNLIREQLARKPFLFSYEPDVLTTQDPSQLLRSSKSPPKGLLLSLVFPGLGEIYAESWVKGLLFLGVEATAWSLYVSNHNKGEDLKDEFKAYAAEYWSEDRWNSWWDSLPQEERELRAHHTLPETKTQQYYEMIGKYMKFNAGWADVDQANALADTSQLGLDYMHIRGQSNDKLKLATTATAIVLANHVFSALDAIWTVSRYNKSARPEVRVRYVMVNNDPVPALNLRLSW